MLIRSLNNKKKTHTENAAVPQESLSIAILIVTILRKRTLEYIYLRKIKI